VAGDGQVKLAKPVAGERVAAALHHDGLRLEAWNTSTTLFMMVLNISQYPSSPTPSISGTFKARY